MMKRFASVIFLFLMVLATAAFAADTLSPWKTETLSVEEESFIMSDKEGFKEAVVYADKSLTSAKVKNLPVDTKIKFIEIALRENPDPRYEEKKGFEAWVRLTQPVKGWVDFDETALGYSDSFMYLFFGEAEED
jgi:hypothetical protein